MSNWNNRPTQNNTSNEVSVDLKDVTSLKTNTADKSSKGTMILWIIFFIFLTVIVLAAILVPLILAVTYSGPFSTTTTTAGSVTTVTNATTTTTTAAVVTTITYSQGFTTASPATTQCTQWQSFVALLTVRSYTLLTMQGTFDTVGKITNDTVVIGNIALALRTSGTYGPVSSNGISWSVGACGAGTELSADSGICGCLTPGYSVRPCIINANWGGINSNSCSGPSQTMTVIFQY